MIDLGLVLAEANSKIIPLSTSSGTQPAESHGWRPEALRAKAIGAGSSRNTQDDQIMPPYMFIFAYPLIGHFLVIQFSYGGSRKNAVRRLSKFSR